MANLRFYFGVMICLAFFAQCDVRVNKYYSANVYGKGNIQIDSDERVEIPIKYFDTILLSDDNVEFEEPEWDSFYLSTTQYSIWRKRVLQMKEWKKKYSLLNLPRLANIIEESTFKTSNGSRTIIAWMTNMGVRLNMNDADENERIDWIYKIQGSGNFSGKLRLSLIDNVRHRIINTIAVRYFSERHKHDTLTYSEELLDWPFAILSKEHIQNYNYELLYYSNGSSAERDGEAEVMHFRDFNGDGKAYEFALFRQDYSFSFFSALCGYCETSDSLKWYGWDLQYHYNTAYIKDTIVKVKQYWIDYAAYLNFDMQGHLNFIRDYTGRMGNRYDYRLRYDPLKDAYSGDVHVTDSEP